MLFGCFVLSFLHVPSASRTSRTENGLQSQISKNVHEKITRRTCNRCCNRRLHIQYTNFRSIDSKSSSVVDVIFQFVRYAHYCFCQRCFFVTSFFACSAISWLCLIDHHLQPDMVVDVDRKIIRFFFFKPNEHKYCDTPCSQCIYEKNVTREYIQSIPSEENVKTFWFFVYNWTSGSQ